MHQPEAPRKALNDIFHLISSGQLELAERKCNTMRTTHPGDVNILGLHGAILLKLGRFDEAQQTLQKTISMEPGFAKPYEDMGRLFLVKKEPEHAVIQFSKAIELDGSRASAYSGLASALAKLGRADEAQGAHQQFLKLSPIAATLVEADQLLREGDRARAEEVCNELLKREPENTHVLRMLARIASDDERLVVAEELLRRIIEQSPNEYLPYKELGRFLIEQSRFVEAIELFEKAVSLNSSIVDNYRLLGDALAVVGRCADALASYRHVLLLRPDEPHALAGQGHMLRIAGNRDEAVASYEKCTLVQPELGDAWWNLASLKGYSLSDEQVQTIQSQITSSEVGDDSEIGMRFALARASESRGDFETAWKNYSLGNSLKRVQINYDPVQTEQMHDAIIENFTGTFLDRGLPDQAPTPKPIFILGLPRSGSTLIEQILASHSMVEGAGELPYVVMLSSSLGSQQPDGLRYPQVVIDLSNTQFKSLGQAYIYHSGVHRRLDQPYFTDKMPANFSHVGLIHMMLPHAKIIDTRRHPMATCVANFRQLYAQGKNQTYDLIEFAEYYLEYCRIMDHWQKVLPGRVLRVQYEDVVADLEGQTRRILEYCELPWEETCLEFHKNTRAVNTVSAEQVREPIYTGAVEFWKHYESQLEPIREILAPVL